MINERLKDVVFIFREEKRGPQSSNEGLLD